MHESISQFEKRKQDHIQFALSPENQCTELNVFDNYSLIHEALPDLDFSEINIEGKRFGSLTATPFLVSSMTAGHKNAQEINRNLLAACDARGWAMGVGSQRRELFDKNAAVDWQPLRQAYPHVFLMGNLGIAQIITAPIKAIQQLTESLQANALIIHCNPLQEVIQPEGTPQFKGCWRALEKLTKALDLPVIIKETGCGFSLNTLKRLNDMGVAAVDISGAGGTHWGRIEGQRAAVDLMRGRTATTFRNWGINTLKSVFDALSLECNYEVWGSGGVRHGLDAAKLLALGVTTVGFAKPMLEAALISVDQVIALMNTIEYELKVALFCTGSRNIIELRGKLCQ